MPRRTYANNDERIAAQAEYKREWYARNQEREKQRMRDRYAAKRAADGGAGGVAQPVA